MKSVSEFFQEVKSNEELRSKFLAAYKKGEIESFLNDNECDATAEEALEFIEQELPSGPYELSDEELALVVGGKGDKNKDNSDQPKYQVGMTVYVLIPGGGDLGGYYYAKVIDVRKKDGIWQYLIDSLGECADQFWTDAGAIQDGGWWD